jgi:hypothetical protein
MFGDDKFFVPHVLKKWGGQNGLGGDTSGVAPKAEGSLRQK